MWICHECDSIWEKWSDIDDGAQGERMEEFLQRRGIKYEELNVLIKAGDHY